MRLSPDRRHNDNRQSDILATGGVHIGGTDFDKQLSLQGMMPLFGYGSRMKSGAYMPTSHHMNLATWHTINSVYSQNPSWPWAACATTSKTPAASTACSS